MTTKEFVRLDYLWGKIALKKCCGWILEPSNLYDFGGNESNYKDVWSRDFLVKITAILKKNI